MPLQPRFVCGAARYPLALESLLTLRAQAWVWSVGFAALRLIARPPIIAARGANVLSSRMPHHRRRRRGATARVDCTCRGPCRPRYRRDAYISTDIAAAPLLWVLPLALYLLTFVAVLHDKPLFSHDLVIKIVRSWSRRSRSPCLAATANTGSPPWRSTAALFVLALACHGEVMRGVRTPVRLTEFYLWTSLAGSYRRRLRRTARAASFQSDLRVSVLVVAALFALPGA